MTDLSQFDGPDPLDVALGRNIRIRRKSLGLSQSALGAAVGLTFQQIQKYESGANRVSFSKLMDISKALTCRVSELIENAEDGQSSATIQDEGDLLATTGALELLQDYSRIREPRLRQALIKAAWARSDLFQPRRQAGRSWPLGAFWASLRFSPASTSFHRTSRSCHRSGEPSGARICECTTPALLVKSWALPRRSTSSRDAER